MKRFLRLFRTLLRPRNLLVIFRLFRSGQAGRATRAWQQGDSIRPLLPVGVPLLIWVYNRTYNKEQARKRESRAQVLRNEKRMYDQAEQRFLREIID
jgi:hypothetical protein